MSTQPDSTAVPAGSELSGTDQRRLLDKLAVQETLDRYWFELGRHDNESVVGAFSPDARYIDADTLYAFRAGPEGATFLNFRGDPRPYYLFKEDLMLKRESGTA
jgi:hypothetical protein